MSPASPSPVMDPVCERWFQPRADKNTHGDEQTKILRRAALPPELVRLEAERHRKEAVSIIGRAQAWNGMGVDKAQGLRL